jgi:dTDP-4-dehydrorhamnose 3,5-epimerase
MQHFGAELNEDNMTSLLVPKDFGHGYLALTDGATVHYQVSYAYTPGAESGLRWDDPELGIEWPMQPTVVSEKDASWPLLSQVPLIERLGGAK